MKLITIIVLGILICGMFIGGYYVDKEIKEEGKMKEPEYQGPVPEGYDLEHFRKTGETKIIEVEE